MNHFAEVTVVIQEQFLCSWKFYRFKHTSLHCIFDHGTLTGDISYMLEALFIVQYRYKLRIKHELKITEE